MPDRRDVVVIGAGPVGLACAIEVRRRGLSVRVIDKGTLVNSIFGYPTNMEFFSTPDLIEIGGYPFPVQHYKPTREDALEYYRGVAAREAIELSLYDRVEAIDGARGDFVVRSSSGDHAARFIVCRELECGKHDLVVVLQQRALVQESLRFLEHVIGIVRQDPLVDRF